MCTIATPISNSPMQLLLPYPTPPFCHDIGKGVVPNRVTQGKER
jgi:hypothetical protein